MWRDGARVFLEAPPKALNALGRVFGISKACIASELEFKGLKDLAEGVAEEVKDLVRGRRFAVRVKRSGKHDFTSIDIAREVGALLKPYSAGVDLSNPEVEVRVEVRGCKAYVIRECVEGPGGLPAGTEGRALTLFSGGFDSPVAAWFAAKRGVEVHFLHFILTSPRSVEEAFAVARELTVKWLHGYSPLFIIADFRKVTEEVAGKVVRSYRQVVLRALMYVAAALIAERMGFDALVTGESIGQASSQTLRNLAVIEEVAFKDLRKPLIIRPLAGMDKEEIIEWSRRIGTHDLSARVREYCAIAPSLVVTRAKPGELEAELGRVSRKLIDECVSKVKVVDVLKSKPSDLMISDGVEIDYIPEGAVVIDVRSLREYREWHYPGAIHVSRAGDLRRFKDRVVVLYCSHGYASYLMAELLRREGVKAYSVKGGVETLKKLSGCRV